MKRLIVICVAAFMFVVFTGGIFKTVEIMTQNGKPLINLDDYILSSSKGGEGSSNSETLVKPLDPQESAKNKNTDETQDTIIIKIEEKIIVMNGKSYTYETAYKSAENFESDLSKFKNYTFEIFNENAEAHAFKYVFNLVLNITDSSNVVCKPYGEQ